jgi:hypothetical protein
MLKGIQPFPIHGRQTDREKSWTEWLQHQCPIKVTVDVIGGRWGEFFGHRALTKTGS